MILKVKSEKKVIIINNVLPDLAVADHTLSLVPVNAVPVCLGCGNGSWTGFLAGLPELLVDHTGLQRLHQNMPIPRGKQEEKMKIEKINTSIKQLHIQ